MLSQMVTSEKHQKSLLGGIERLVGLSHPDLLPFVPKVLMALYQADIIEEEVVTQWGTHVSKKYVDKDTSKRVRKASEPFLKWLEEAEDSEGSDEE
jgi:translation initiation factor 5